MDNNVTYTPLMSTYWNNNVNNNNNLYNALTSTFRPQPPVRMAASQHPYVNHAPASTLQQQHSCDLVTIFLCCQSFPNQLPSD
jgi:hypothetical protein